MTDAHAVIDTVERAKSSPEKVLPYADLGLTSAEYDRIVTLLGRRPTAAELAMYSVMWSEHCSYKSSKIHLKQFGQKMTEKMREHLLVGIGENAGVIDIGEGWAVTFKVESHNHPSFIDPFGGSATGIGGIVRDIVAMGARPIAVQGQLRFGAVDAPDTARIVRGVFDGLSDYANGIGVPNVGGQTVFDRCYQGNPLVNAVCVGALRHEDIHLASASGAGNLVIIFGCPTGGDGIGGASILASETFDETADDGEVEAKSRPTVPQGNPDMGTRIIEACSEMFAAGLVEGIQDLGAAGISCATSELASNGDSGMHITLDRVPLREHLTAGEILMSETQERMMAVVTPENLEAFMDIAERWEVGAQVIGEVREGSRLVIESDGEVIVDVDPRTVAHDGPVYDRPYARPQWQDELQRPTELRLPETGNDIRRAILEVVASPNAADTSMFDEQFNTDVQGNTHLSAPDDAGVVRVDQETGRGIAVSSYANGRYTKLDPRTGAGQALAQAYRQVAAVGAQPLGISDGLNFGSPEHPDGMWQLVEAMTGIADGCQELNIPVTGGNVSLYNGTGELGQVDSSIHPTPIIAVVGGLDDVLRAVPSGPRDSGLAIYLLGETKAELGGSLLADVLYSDLSGMPPSVDFAAEEQLAGVLVHSSRDGLLDASHALGEGGLALALTHFCLRYGVGARIVLDEVLESSGLDPATLLFSESGARAIVAVPRSEEVRFTDLVTGRNMPHYRIGITDAGAAGSDGAPQTSEPVLEIQGLLSLRVAELSEASRAIMPHFFSA